MTKAKTMLMVLSVALVGALSSPICAQNFRAASAASYIDRGHVSFGKGNLESALADFSIALSFDPQSAVAYYNRGVVRGAQHELDLALNDFNRALQIDVQLAEAWVNRTAVRYAYVIWEWPSATSIEPSSSSRDWLSPGPFAALFSSPEANSRQPLPIAANRSNSTRTSQRITAIAALRANSEAIWMEPSRINHRQSNLIHN